MSEILSQAEIEALVEQATAAVDHAYFAPVVLLLCLFLRRWRHVSIYALCYGAAVGLASCALFLAPHAFLNWLFD